MPARAWKFRIEDILEAIEDINRLTSGMTYGIFCADNKTTKAVLYSMAVIGEAARRVPADIALRHSEIPSQIERFLHACQEKSFETNEFTLTRPLPSRERSNVVVPLPWREG